MAESSERPVRPTSARVNLSAIAGNYGALCSVASSAEVCAVVKANAYGHGMGPVSLRLEREGCRRFAVGTLDEGMELRGYGVEGEILLLQGPPRGAGHFLKNQSLTPVISDMETLLALSREAQDKGIELPIHLKFDTGMGRLGFSAAEVPMVREVLSVRSGLRLSGVATHFARAGESDAATEGQLSLFREVLAAFEAAAVEPCVAHAANSAACLSKVDCHFNVVRLGLALYGILPEPGLRFAPNLTPALSWVSEVEQVREVPEGWPLSYGGTFVTKRPSRIAVVPVGYADGYRRALGNRAQVLVRGRRAPVVGRVTMDLTLVDVTEVGGVQRGDEVVLLGRQGGETLSAGEMAGWLDTIPYEILCCIGPRVYRIYEEDE